MNDLPNELVCMIFGHLTLSDLFHNCKLVSKRWLELVDSMKFQELIMLDSKYSIFGPLCYAETNRRINPNNVLFIDRKFGTFKIKFNNFNNLKFLNLNFSNTGSELKFEIESLNKFIQLEHLIVTGRIILTKNSTLYLPNLKTISLNYSVYLNKPEDELLIDAIKLERVKLIDFQNLVIKFIHPESIKFLIYSDEDVKNDYKQFSNLEVCRIKIGFIQPHIIHQLFNLFSRLPNDLKELHLDYRQYECGIHYSRYLGKRIEFFKYLMDEKMRLNLNLNLYVNGIKLIDNEPIKESVFDYGRLFEDYLKNYEKIAQFPGLSDINYNKLINFFKVIPDDFCTKFQNINTIKIQTTNQEIDQDQFISFLNGCLNLRTLYINEDRTMCTKPLDQQFYNQLPKIANLLSCLEIYFKSEKSLINFEFISDFKILVDFKTDQYLPLEEAKNLFKCNRFLDHFEFSNENSTAVIIRTHKRYNLISVKIWELSVKSRLKDRNCRFYYVNR